MSPYERSAVPATPPNILLITSDQQHWNTIGRHNPELRTPSLDRLAEEGTLFTRAYCPNPTCTPTRASIITGQYPSQHGAYSLGTKLLEDRLTVGEVFSRHGYGSALVGKAHFQQTVNHEDFSSIESTPLVRDLDYWRKFHGPFYGFDHVELARNHADESHVGQHYAVWMEDKGLKDWKRHFQNRGHGYDFNDPGMSTEPQYLTWSIPEAYHYNTWIAERTNALMDSYHAANQPFCLWASFFDPHPPYLVPEPWDTMYDPEAVTVPGITPGEHNRNPEHFRKTQERDPDFSDWQEPGGNAMHGCSSHLVDRGELAKRIAVYYGMISCMDKYIGEILDHLDRLGLAGNTLVVFTSDHGHLYGQHGLTTKGPFHYEDLIRVPFIARRPGHIEAGAESDALQSLVDLAPTFLGAAGIDAPAAMTGIDQSTAWGRGEAVRDHILVENRHQPTTIHLRTYVDARHKITVYRGHAYGEIFDLAEDPGELNNLWDDPAASGLKTELLLKLAQADLAREPLPMPRVAGA